MTIVLRAARIASACWRREHHLGDLGRVREVGQACLEHIDPRRLKSFLELSLEGAADFVGVRAQRDRALRIVVVGVVVGQVAQRGLALDGYELLVILDVEHGLGRVDDAPDDDRGDLDRIPTRVVHLDPVALEVPHPQQDPLSPQHRKRVDPPQTGLGERPDVAAEQDQQARLVGLHDDEPGGAQDQDDRNHASGDPQPGASSAEPERDQRARECHDPDKHRHHGRTRERGRRALLMRRSRRGRQTGRAAHAVVR